MRRASWHCNSRSDIVHSCWPLLIVLLGCLVCLEVAFVSVGADGDPSLDASAGLDSASLIGMRVEPVVAKDSGVLQIAPVEAANALSYTALLPWVTRGYWPKQPLSFGVQIFHVQPEIVSKTIEARANWVRLPISWSSIEPANTTPEYYQWSVSFESALKRLADRDCKIILTLVGNPGWAASYPGGPIDRTDIGELVEFLSTAVARYSVAPYHVKYWELYNEPDNGNSLWASYGWGYFGNEPAAYAQMLAAVYPAMKAANPQIFVLFGGLAFDNWIEDDPPGPFVKGFLDQVLANGAGPYFDVMNFHYYTPYDGRWAPYGPGLAGKTAFLQDKLKSYGLDKPFICTETAEQSSEGGGSDEAQSRYVVQALTRGVAAGLEAVIWFKLVDDAEGGYWMTGLLNSDLSPNPAFYAYQTLVDQLYAAEYKGAVDPMELGSEPIEAYAFFEVTTGTQILVAWSKDGLDHEIVVVTEQVIVVDKYGEQTIHDDEDDGALDGQVRLDIGGSPVYLRFAASN